jgi:leucyl aminopeptidase (aminopeptidase T)
MAAARAAGRCACPCKLTAHLLKHAPDRGARLVDGCNDGVPLVARHALQVAHDRERGKAVQAAGGLVQEDDAGRGQVAGSNRQTLALAAAQAAQHEASRQRAAHKALLPVLEAHGRQHVGHALLALRLGLRAGQDDAGVEVERLRRGHRSHKVVLLRQTCG